MTNAVDPGPQRELRELFERRLGHVLNDRATQELTEALSRLTKSCGFETTGQYLALLRTLPLDAPMVQALLQTVTNNETYFFRDPTSVQSLRTHILPGLIERALETRTFRVWSAGCSTGEELYTIGILLRELIPDIDFWNIALIGTDIDAAALARARRGHYKQWSFRVTSDEERQRYFDAAGDGTFVLRRRFTKGAAFSLHNLSDPGEPAPAPGKFDLILCRNVAIYMHAEARSVLAQKVARALASDGVWVSGPSDPVPPAGFTTRVLPGVLEHVVHEERVAATATVATRRVPEVSTPVSPDQQPTWRPPPGWDTSMKPAPPALLRTLVPASPPLRRPPPPQKFEPVAALDAARSLADKGDSSRALEVIGKVIEENPLEPEAYLLRALLFESAGSLDEACADLKRVTYLDPSHGEAYLRLGLLLARRREPEAAVKALRNALVLGYGDESPEAGDLRRTAALQLMRTLRGKNDNG